jgi:hypothetical protein
MNAIDRPACFGEVRAYGFVPTARHEDRTDVELRLEVAVKDGPLPPLPGGQVQLLPVTRFERPVERIDVV